VPSLSGCCPAGVTQQDQEDDEVHYLTSQSWPVMG
jgi:hypothetical protein